MVKGWHIIIQHPVSASLSFSRKGHVAIVEYLGVMMVPLLKTPPPPPAQSAPPPLRRRQSREARSSEASDTSGTGNGNEDITVPVAGTRSGTETDTTLDSVPEESEGEDN